MKNLFALAVCMLVMCSAFSQVSYVQSRIVPNDREAEFVEKETKYWSKVAKAAIDKGHMVQWALWRKVGISQPGEPNYLFVNTFEKFDGIDQSAVWSEANVKMMGADPNFVETNSFTTTYQDLWMQQEASVNGNSKFIVVNYVKAPNRGAFIDENIALWKPFFEKHIKAKTFGMTSWGISSVTYPLGNKTSFNCITWDGFNNMSAALNMLRYQKLTTANPYNEVLSKSKMAEILPNGFEQRTIFELVMAVAK